MDCRVPAVVPVASGPGIGRCAGLMNIRTHPAKTVVSIRTMPIVYCGSVIFEDRDVYGRRDFIAGDARDILG